MSRLRAPVVLAALALACARNSEPLPQADYERALENFWRPCEDALAAAGVVGVDLTAAREARRQAHRRIIAEMNRLGMSPADLERPREYLARAREPALRVVLAMHTDSAVAEAALEGPIEEWLAAAGRVLVRSVALLTARERLRDRPFDEALPGDERAYARAAIRMLADRTFLEALPSGMEAQRVLDPDPLHLAAMGERPPREGDPPAFFAAYALWLAEEPSPLPPAEMDRLRASDPQNGLWTILQCADDPDIRCIEPVREVRTYLREIWAAHARSYRGPMAPLVATHRLTLPHVTRMQMAVARVVGRIRGTGDLSVGEAGWLRALEAMRHAAVFPLEWAAIREMEGDFYAALDLPGAAARAWTEAAAVRLFAPEDRMLAALRAAALAEDPQEAFARLCTDEWRDGVLAEAARRWERHVDATPAQYGDWPTLRDAHWNDRDAPDPLVSMAWGLRHHWWGGE